MATRKAGTRLAGSSAVGGSDVDHFAPGRAPAAGVTTSAPGAADWR